MGRVLLMTRSQACRIILKYMDKSINGNENLVQIRKIL